MPWHIAKQDDEWCVIKDSDGSTEGCHLTEADAKSHMAALYSSESKSLAPRDDLIRMIPVTEIRTSEDGSTLFGHAAVFNEWTTIDSFWEGKFKERISPGAFKKTLNERGNQVKVLFNHGFDPQIGDKPLGKPRKMEEDDRGLYVEVPLDDTSYNRDIKALLTSGALDGMSFRFSVTKEAWDRKSEQDTDDLDERTIQEVKLFEFGPVTFPAYEATTAGVRSLVGYTEWRKRTVDQPATIPAEAAATPDAGAGDTSAEDEPRDALVASVSRLRLYADFLGDYVPAIERKALKYDS